MYRKWIWALDRDVIELSLGSAALLAFAVILLVVERY